MSRRDEDRITKEEELEIERQIRAGERAVDEHGSHYDPRKPRYHYDPERGEWIYPSMSHSGCSGCVPRRGSMAGFRGDGDDNEMRDARRSAAEEQRRYDEEGHREYESFLAHRRRLREAGLPLDLLAIPDGPELQQRIDYLKRTNPTSNEIRSLEDRLREKWEYETQLEARAEPEPLRAHASGYWRFTQILNTSGDGQGWKVTLDGKSAGVVMIRGRDLVVFSTTMDSSERRRAGITGADPTPEDIMAAFLKLYPSGAPDALAATRRELPGFGPPRDWSED